MADAIEEKKHDPVLVPPYDLFWLWTELNQSLRTLNFTMSGVAIQHLNLNATFEACRNLAIQFDSKDWETIKYFESIAMAAFYAAQKVRMEREKNG